MYPALAVLQAEKNNSDLEVLWVGSDDGIEKDLVEREGIRFIGIPAAGIHGVNILSLPGRCVKILRGLNAAKGIIRDFQPDVMFFTGGYVGWPVAQAGKGIPSVVFVPDIEPGMMLDQLGKSADLITVVCEDSVPYFKNSKRVEITGYPTRAGMQRMDKAEALDHFALAEDAPVLFVFGGSKGAQSINRALWQNLPELLQVCQVIHVTGKNNWEEANAFCETLTEEQEKRYRVYPYLHEEMGTAFSCADLVISRAGASTLGEFPLFGVPAILVPYPYAWRYQKVNADYLVSRDAAMLIRDEELAEQMVPTVLDLFSHPEKTAEMRKAMERLARPDAAANIMKLIRECAGSK